MDIDFDVSAQFHISDDGEEMIVVLNTNIFEPKEGNVYPFKMSVEIEGYSFPICKGTCLYIYGECECYAINFANS